MAYQFGNTQQHQQQVTRPSKRRMDDDEPTTAKRFFDVNTQFSPDQPLPQQSIPAITFASPDYKPPPRDEVPLWLQPVNAAASPMTEDESEDETVLLTPSCLQGQQQQQQKQQQSFGRPAVDYWGDMMVDQWQ